MIRRRLRLPVVVKRDFQPTFCATGRGVSYHTGAYIRGGRHTCAVKVDGSLDLLELVLNKWVRVVAVGVVVRERLESIGFASLSDEPTRGLRSEPEEYELGDSGAALENGRDTPRPAVRNVECAECGPSSAERDGQRSAAVVLKGRFTYTILPRNLRTTDMSMNDTLND